jgi:hypothetical protein
MDDATYRATREYVIAQLDQAFRWQAARLVRKTHPQP